MSTFPPSSPLFYDEDHSDLEPASPIKSSLQFKDTLGPIGSKKPVGPIKGFLKKPFMLKTSAAIDSAKFDYPTPEPSSSLGNAGTSSPVREDAEPNFTHSNKSKEPLINEPMQGPKLGEFNQTLHSTFFQAFQPSKTEKIKLTRKVIQTFELPIDGTEFIFGRSNACDILLMDKSKLISRKHAAARFDVSSNSFVVKCFSVNALEVVVPYDADVKKLGGSDIFELAPRSEGYESLQSLSYKDLAIKGLTKFSRELKNEGCSTKILVLNNEALRIPRQGNDEITLIIRGIQCVLAAENEDPNTTDDGILKKETIQKAKTSVELFKVDSLKVSHVNFFDAISTPIKKATTINTGIKPVKMKMNIGKINPLFKEDETTTSTLNVDTVSTPEKIPAYVTATPENIASSKKIYLSTMSSQNAPNCNTFESQKIDPVKKLFSSTPTISIKKIKQIIAEDDDMGTETSLLTPLSKKRKSDKAAGSGNSSKSTNKKHKFSSTSSKEYDFQDPKTLIDAANEDVTKKQRLLGEISNLDEIKKIVINHLAFSRLASTPLTQLRAISKKLDIFDKKLIRLILSDIPCVGVIYRKGKDAAGKPLDEEYYYDIEKDADAERVQLVNSVKGGSSLRSCRKTHKQYYWKRPPPLPKY